ncbi:ChbG/HpnK family deacetylase [Saccharothrix sp. NRRL B-16314]|uniref:ChbG/HpnK family deacetylase n=1 Tax=Saccharothrix sp. NRRL B-16314 TaxID=1463825 RepID=UPI000526CDDD|nr:ChbG/HpnK family deacetylase [Saccharothrix sp. NRRL B-16314]
MDHTGFTRSSELLGYPPDARVLIVNCDDLGMHEDVDVAVVESIEAGIARSCSLMTSGPSARHAVGLLRRHPGITFGIHLTLVRDAVADRWGPLAAKEDVGSLLDEDGLLFTAARRGELRARARTDEVEAEFRAQIDAVFGFGNGLGDGLRERLTHLDFHCLADGGRDDVLAVATALAAEHGLAVRVWLDEGRRRMRRRGLPVTDNPFLDSFSVDVDTKPARYARLLRDLPPGLSEWAVHPSVASERSRAVDGGWRVRRSDYEFLISPQARELIDREGITVIDYRPLQEVWASSTSR